MDITQLASELHVWHVRNYPKETDVQALLSVGEEFGELERAELKQAGGIRGTWEEWQIEKQKEIGDVFISLIEFAVRTNTVKNVKVAFESHETLYPVRMERGSVCYYTYDLYWKTWSICLAESNWGTVIMPLSTSEYALLALKAMLGHISAAFVTKDSAPQKLSDSIDAFVYGLCEYAKLTNIDIKASLASRWQTISKRDFIVNPLTGGRENEV